MGSHSSPYGEPRTVAGFEVSFMATTFSRSVARSLDVYAKDGDEEVLLTDESIDDEPDDDAIIDMLDWAIDEGKLPGPWRAKYEIRSLVGDSLVAEGTCVVRARSEQAAEAAAIAWVHDNDPHDDPRIDPIIEVTDTQVVSLHKAGEAALSGGASS